MEISTSRIFPLLPLKPGEVHVWFAFPQEITDPALLQAYHSLMNNEEKQKQERYCLEKDRHDCLITRALVRSVLSRYVEKDPGDWEFTQNKYGRPEIKWGGEDNRDNSALCFNLSHTEGLVACAVALEHDVGIDVENAQKRAINLDIADRFFSSLEIQALRSLPVSERRKRFFDYWTLKESYIKARGQGLSIPIDQCAFILREDGLINISFGDRIVDNPEFWQFYRLQPTDKHIAAVAIHKGYLPTCELTTRKITPLVKEEVW